jgi:hypothetical protein
MRATSLVCLLHIPLLLYELIRNEGRPLMPHKVLQLVLQYVKSIQNNNTGRYTTAWELVIQWCVVAAQPDAQGDSLVAFSVEAITEEDDAEFGQWVEQRLDSTLGKKAQHGRDPEHYNVTKGSRNSPPTLCR